MVFYVLVTASIPNDQILLMSTHRCDSVPVMPSQAISGPCTHGKSSTASLLVVVCSRFNFAKVHIRRLSIPPS